jgi:hypothetical protein
MTRVASISACTPFQKSLGYVNMDPVTRTAENTPKCAYSLYMVPLRNHLNQHIVALSIFYKLIQLI